MAINFSKLSYLQNITAQDIPETYQKWICELNAPTIIDFTVEGSDRWRVVTTLLHGNEPSGFIALHNWIMQASYEQLAVNVRFIVCSVEAAKFEPLFSTRFLSGGKDINRCFGIKSLSDYYLRAELIASCVRQVKPEAIVDIHNTTGKSPAFGVSTNGHKEHLSIASLFCDSVVVSHIKLGGLIEQDFSCSVLTIETGNSHDEKANKVALEGIEQFCSLDNVLNLEASRDIEVVHQPHRLLLKHNIELTYSEQMPTEGVSIRRDIEDFNQDIMYAGTSIGWVDEFALANFDIEDANNKATLDDFFEVKNSQLIAKRDIRVFKATTKRKTAVHDCLFYFVCEQRL